MVRQSVNLLPTYFRTDKNKKFLASTIDQFIQQPDIERLDGFIGSKLSPNYVPSTDRYISDPLALRDKYQLVPGLVVKTLDGAIAAAYGYDDLINQLSYFGSKVDNLNTLFKPEFYSYDPHIDWDKFVNYNQYYWLPTGPQPIQITGTQRELVSTYTVTDSDDGNFFVFTPDGLTPDPLLTLYRGVTYVFNVDTKRPIYIKRSATSGAGNLYESDIKGNGTKKGQIILTVSYTAPNVLYYESDDGEFAGGEIVIKTILENSYIDVEKEILGKKEFTSNQGVKFINGLKVKFGGTVTPLKYAGNEYLVEGVGDKIQLIDFSSLETPEFVATTYDADFDGTAFDNFPFDNFKNIPLIPEYVTINKASQDKNPWSRYNRWFHIDVIKTSAAANNIVFDTPAAQVAKRPIIEFRPDLQLFNFGTSGVTKVDVIDTVTTDAFSRVEKSTGYWVDGVLLEQGFRVIFNADPDPIVRGRIFEVQIVNIDNITEQYPQVGQYINLRPADDHIPALNSSVIILRGDADGKKSWRYTTVSGVDQWVESQQRTTRNQAPLFDVFDDNGYSFGDVNHNSNFAGTRVFGYKIGNGVADSVLGFPLSYRSVGLESAYLFENYFMTDTVMRINASSSSMVDVKSGYLKLTSNLASPEYITPWVDAVDFEIPVVQSQVVYEQTTFIEITTFDNPAYLDDLRVTVFVNDKKYTSDLYSFYKNLEKLYIQFNTAIPASTKGNRIKFELYSATIPNSQGTYDVPINLTNNPLNGPITDFTLSEVVDHVNTMANRHPGFTGVFPGAGNLSSLDNLSAYGTRLIINKNPLSFAQYFISNKEHNLFESIKIASDDYNQFKLNLVKSIAELDNIYTPAEALDAVMIALNENKNTTFPYLLSDMLPTGTNKKIRLYTVTDRRNQQYSISAVFSNDVISNQAILIYINDEQVLYGTDYSFNQYDSTVTILKPLVKGDTIEIHEYVNTDGCYVAPTPTKLGLYPKFEPMLMLDQSYAEGAKWVIQGHDGSLVIAFGDYSLDDTGSVVREDYRDYILLEYETRIFNNLKTQYDPGLFDINSILPGAFREEKYTYAETYSFIQDLFLRWTGFYGVDYESNTTYNVNNHLTYNYKSGIDYIFGKSIPGSWRAIYKYYFDTDRPNTHPWEMLGISIKPTWWDSYYGPAPYTSGNSVLWADLETGTIALGPHAGIYPKYARPGLYKIIPVDDNGALIDPREWAGIYTNDSIPDTSQSWSFGDWGPAENAWRKSSNWPFAVQILAALIKPADYTGKLFDTSRVILNKSGHYTYGSNNSFLSPASLLLQGEVVDGNTVRAAGYGVYVIEFGKKRQANYISTLKSHLTNGTFNLLFKTGGFINKDKFNVIIDSAQLGSLSPIPFLPAEDFTVHFNVSNPVKSLAISGLIIIKSNGKFILRGYDKKNLYFTINNPIHQVSDVTLSIGDTSVDFLTWTTGQNYQAGQIVFYNSVYYRVILNHAAGSAFNGSYYKALPALPSNPGLSVQKAANFETEETVVHYGTEFDTIQQVYDFISGYSNWLTGQGFIFDEYNSDFGETIDWDFTAKEFMYWTTQNWANNSVVTLSPFANSLTLQYNEGVVDNVLDSFYEYSIFRADGLTFPNTKFSTIRDNGTFTITTKNTPDGIFFARLNLVQKEHILVFNNKTIFNDVLYDPESGYRQLRLKIQGFRTASWNGDFYSPGFVYDNASIAMWSEYTDYLPADVVQYVGKYYSAKGKVTGTEKFDFSKWYLLPEKPVAKLLPNFDYKINQFEDFYSLDIDNFDLSQQQMSQHLTGYSPRPYLDNVFSDGIAQYKFYQGYIKEKGTLNAIEKLKKASVANLQGYLDVKEEWAVRIGEFGAFSNYTELEIPLNEGDFLENGQVLQLVDVKPLAGNDIISYIPTSSLHIAPPAYNPSSAFITSTGTLNNNNLIMPVAGYPRLDDVDYTITSTNALLNVADNSIFKEGNTIWIGFDNTQGWNVYRYTRQLAAITSATQEGIVITVDTDRPHGLGIGDIVSITKLDPETDKIYLVESTPSQTKFTVTSSNYLSQSVTNEGIMFKFNNSRLATIDDISRVPNLAEIADGEIFWIDDNSRNKWAAYKKTHNYLPTKINPRLNQTGEHFGSKIVKHENSTTVIIGASDYYDSTAGLGRIFIYDKSPVDGSLNYVYNYGVDKAENQWRPTNDPNPFGEVIEYDEVDDLVFASAPYANTVTSLSVFTTNTGLVQISGIFRQGNKDSITYSVLYAPSPNAAHTRFGSAIHVQRELQNKRILIGAPGANIVYRYDMSIAGTTSTLYKVKGDPVGSTLSNYVPAEFTVSLLANRKYDFTVTNTGSGYTSSTYIRIPGTTLGGFIHINDLVIDIGTVNASGSITSIVTTATMTKNSVAPVKQFHISAPSVAMTPVAGSPYFAEFGSVISGSKDGNIIAVSAPLSNTATGAVMVYTYTTVTNTYEQVQTIDPRFKEVNSLYRNSIKTNDKFGKATAISDDGKYMFISSFTANDGIYRAGKVGVYEWTITSANPGGFYDMVQLLDNPSREPNLNFGQAISVNADGSKLAITSQGAPFFNSVMFDNGTTTFDAESCRFGEIIDNSGTAYVYERYDTKFLLSQELIDNTIDDGGRYGYSIAVDNDSAYIGNPDYGTTGTSYGSIYSWIKQDKTAGSWSEFRVQDDLVNVDLIKKSFTVDSLKEQLVDYVDIIDPLKNKVAGLAEQELSYKLAFDPAIYYVGNDVVVADYDKYWKEEHLGELWWDLSTVKYVWYEQGELLYRRNAWGKTFPGSSIDVYEWVESTYLPSQWAALADTDAGLVTGISGQPKFPDDSVYSSKDLFDKNTGVFTTLYYFWVKSKTTIPMHTGRKIPAVEVENLIRDPKGYGLKYINVIASDAISIMNYNSNLISNRISLNIGFNSVENNVNKHTEWLLLQEGSQESQPPASLERKLFDSLLGVDKKGNPVPDNKLPARLKYGTGIRPRQTMFVNRKEALRDLLEYTNGILLNKKITGFYEFKNLNSKDDIPDVLLGAYDVIVEDLDQLNRIQTGLFRQASLTCSVINGRIESVEIVDGGQGYLVPPTVLINDGVNPAHIKTIIDNSGAITGVSIDNPGFGFVVAPTLYVRPFTVILQVDPEFPAKWSKHEWLNNSWNRVYTQTYNTPSYWKYVDWADPTYSNLQPILYTVDEVYELQTLDLIAGNYVKVKNSGAGRYAILKYVDTGLGNFDTNFDIVYSENGTIQFLNTVWDYISAQIGYDDVATFDQTQFDQTPDVELGNILTAIKDDLFVGENRIYWNGFFFRAIKYALTEQQFVDWAFKTSFINVKNIAGVLDQRSTYRFQDPVWYESYLKEVKPYHTEIRNYQLNYQVGDSTSSPWEPSLTYTTDFDLPAYYDPLTKEFTSIGTFTNKLLEYPYRGWAENLTYQVDSIEVTFPGSGYTITPKVDIIAAPGDTGQGATAVAYIASGKVYHVEVTNAGFGYTVTPTVVFSGGGNTQLNPALAYPMLTNNKVRSNFVNIKFDRITANREVGSSMVTFTTSTSGTIREFDLPWYASYDNTATDLTLDGIIVFGSEFTITNHTSVFGDHKKKYSKLVLGSIPTKGQHLKITYKKNIELYSAAERIEDYYIPGVGMPGKSLEQLMAGIEYPGLRIDTLPFEADSGFGVTPFGGRNWDNYIPDVFYSTTTVVTASVTTGSPFIAWNTTTAYIGAWTTATYIGAWNTGTPFRTWTTTTLVNNWTTSTPYHAWSTSTPYIDTWSTSTPFVYNWTTSTPFRTWSTATPYIDTWSTTTLVNDWTTTTSLQVWSTATPFINNWTTSSVGAFTNWVVPTTSSWTIFDITWTPGAYNNAGFNYLSGVGTIQSTLAIWTPTASVAQLVVPPSSGKIGRQTGTPGSSYRMNLSGVANSASWALSADDFTVELYAMVTVTNVITTSSNIWRWTEENSYPQADPYTDNGFGISVTSGTNNIEYYARGVVHVTTATLTINSWTHIALVRQAGVVNIFNNGILIATTSTDTQTWAGGYITIGGGARTTTTPDSVEGMVGNILGLRFTNTSTYTTDFTPPIADAITATNTTRYLMPAKYTSYKDFVFTELQQTQITRDFDNSLYSTQTYTIISSQYSSLNRQQFNISQPVNTNGLLINEGSFYGTISWLAGSTSTVNGGIVWTTSTPFINWTTSTPFLEWNTSSPFIVWNTTTPYISEWNTSTPFLGWTTSTPFVNWTTATPYLSEWTTSTPVRSWTTATPFKDTWSTTTLVNNWSTSSLANSWTTSTPYVTTWSTGTATYTSVAGHSLNGTGTGASVSISILSDLTYDVGTGTPGVNFTVTETLVFYGTDLGGTSPANDLTVTVVSVDVLGAITDITFTGTAVWSTSTPYTAAWTTATPFIVWNTTTPFISWNTTTPYIYGWSTSTPYNSWDYWTTSSPFIVWNTTTPFIGWTTSTPFTTWTTTTPYAGAFSTSSPYIGIWSPIPVYQSFTTPVVSTGTELNVYVENWGITPASTNTILLNSIRVDGNTQYGVPTIVGTGTRELVSIPGTAFNTASSFSKVVFRTTEENAALLSSDIDTVISGGTLETFNNGAFATGRGLAPSDIILDGDKFVTPFTSHAPEEVVPGQVRDSLSLSVFTQAASGSPLIINQTVLVTSSNTSLLLNAIPPSTSSIMISFNGRYLLSGRDYTYNYNTNAVDISVSAETGLASVTVVGVGGTNLLKTYSSVTTTDTSTFKTHLLASNVGSVYLTVSGKTAVKDATTGLGYNVTSGANNEGVINVYGMSTSTDNLIQAWVFKPTYKAYSEVKEQYAEITTTTSEIVLVQPPGNVGPFEDQMIVAVNGLRLNPPETTYYRVANAQVEFIIHPASQVPRGAYSLSSLEVYLNGTKLNNASDFVLENNTNRILFVNGFLKDGDVLAIATFNKSDYKVRNGKLVFAKPLTTADNYVTIITYTNQDASNIRSERFYANGSLYYSMERATIDRSYVWVSVNGHPLINGQDYSVLDDNTTVKISDNYILNVGDNIVLTSFSDNTADKSTGFRIFRDMFDRVQYKRYSAKNTTLLASPLYTTSTTISVRNGDVLSIPIPSQNYPGVVFINGERIEYMTKVGNVLGQLLRGTLGTGPQTVYPAGTSVVDAGRSQTVPDASTSLVQRHITTTATSYTITTATTTSTGAGIILNPNVKAVDQVEVYYAGRYLSKAPVVTHNREIGYDSTENGSDTVGLPEFTITGTTLLLNVKVESGKSLVIVQRQDRVWYNIGIGSATNGITLENSTTPQATFLLEKQSGLPDKYQYGQI